MRVYGNRMEIVQNVCKEGALSGYCFKLHDLLRYRKRERYGEREKRERYREREKERERERGDRDNNREREERKRERKKHDTWQSLSNFSCVL